MLASGTSAFSISEDIDRSSARRRAKAAAGYFFHLCLEMTGAITLAVIFGIFFLVQILDQVFMFKGRH